MSPDEIRAAAEGWLAQYPAAAAALAVLALALAALIADWLARRVIAAAVRRRLKSSSSGPFATALLESRVLLRFAHLAPALVLFFGVRVLDPYQEVGWTRALGVLAFAWVVLAAIAGGVSVLKAAGLYLHSTPGSHARLPLKGYAQAVSLVLYIVAGLVIVAYATGVSVWLLLSSLGALTAVLLLVFRDTLLSVLASIQISVNDVVRIGDWVEMPSHNVDGDVVDIALHTVTVRNWDKTLSTIPTQDFITGSFRNWRGMSEDGARRIKRALYIDMATVRFLEEEEIKRFSKFKLLAEYIPGKHREMSDYNRRIGAEELAVNLRRLTNVGTFRAYLFNYIKNHPKVHAERTTLVRQLQPGPDGLPIEIYCFAATTDWQAYEDLQSDLFDHFLAVAPEFGLNVFQRASGRDLRASARPVVT
ncbi:MAG: mechanosensitive ion channel [Gammaproteobacteria bacterium]|nr:mechanosensitive ion channel [Gammaproteobacteria bacterium]